MRDPNRLDHFYDTFRDIHKKYFPDQRFGQFISNFFGWAIGEKKISDIWFPEEDKWIDLLKEYVINTVKGVTWEDL